MELHGPIMLTDMQKLWLALYIKSIFISILRKQLRIGQFSLFSFFLAIYVISNWQTSYDSSILRQDYGIVRYLPMNCTSFVDWVTIWVVHLPERIEQAGLINASAQTVNSYNSWFKTNIFIIRMVKSNL